MAMMSAQASSKMDKLSELSLVQMTAQVIFLLSDLGSAQPMVMQLDHPTVHSLDHPTVLQLDHWMVRELDHPTVLLLDHA
jgi:hypothetical protein